MNITQLRIKIAHFLYCIPLIRTLMAELKLHQLLLPSLKQPLAISTNYKFQILIEPDIPGLEKALYLYGSYEMGTLFIIKHVLKSNEFFIDIGSNIGFITLFASKIVGTKGMVYSFEPEPKIFTCLQKNLKLNKIVNVQAKNIAVGSENIKEATIYPYISRKNATLLKLQAPNSLGINVRIISIDNFIQNNDISNIKMIKIDVEGWELEVLRGAQNLLKNPNAPVICIEYTSVHPIQGGLNIDIYNYIKLINNYKIFRLDGGKDKKGKLIEIRSPNDLPKHDNLFCFLPNHLNELPSKLFHQKKKRD